jgi:hypothetical protein
MAISKCPKCESTIFEMIENTPHHSNYKLQFIQCSSCKTVIGVMDFYNIGYKLEQLEKQIEEMDNKINSLL